jgi:hypothetical protein
VLIIIDFGFESYARTYSSVSGGVRGGAGRFLNLTQDGKIGSFALFWQLEVLIAGLVSSD